MEGQTPIQVIYYIYFTEKQQQQEGGGNNSAKMEGAESDDISASFLTSEPYMVEGHSVHSQPHEDEEKEEVPHVLREQDRFLPIANVARIMKRGIPKTGKVRHDRVTCCLGAEHLYLLLFMIIQIHGELRKYMIWTNCSVIEILIPLLLFSFNYLFIYSLILL